MRKLSMKTYIIIVISIMLFNEIFAIFATVLFDKKDYYGEPETVLSYEDIFYDFDKTDELSYYYTNYSDNQESSFEKIKSTLQNTEYKIVSKFKARFMVLFQSKSRSCGMIMVEEIIENELSDEYKNYTNETSPKAIYARLFKMNGKYYLYYYPKTENLMSGFTVCEIMNTEAFKNSNDLNAHADLYTYPYVYPSYMMQVRYNYFVSAGLLIFYLLECRIVGWIVLKHKNKSK